MKRNVDCNHNIKSENKILKKTTDKEYCKLNKNTEIHKDETKLKFKKLKNEISLLKEDLLRSRADFENIRRRSQEDLIKAHKFGIQSFVESLIPVKDSLEQAIIQKDQTLNDLIEGVKITLRQLSSSFENFKIKEISPKYGDDFDPNIHQAISCIYSKISNNKIIRVLQKGYSISNRNIRPSMVSITSNQK